MASRMMIVSPAETVSPSAAVTLNTLPAVPQTTGSPWTAVPVLVDLAADLAGEADLAWAVLEPADGSPDDAAEALADGEEPVPAADADDELEALLLFFSTSTSYSIPFILTIYVSMLIS